MLDPTLPLVSPLTDSTRLEQAKNSKEASEQFEAFMFTFLAKTLRSTVPNGPFSSGPMQTFGELFDQEIGKRVGEGHALGLADSLENSLQMQGLTPHTASRPMRIPQTDERPELGVVGRLTGRFGARQDPINGKSGFHPGIDIAAPAGTPIHAVEAGRVVFAGKNGGYGNFIVIDHGNNTLTRYAHCQRIDVTVGQEISANEVIGAVGSTGHSTGPHLHLEVYQDGEAVDPLQVEWLKGSGG
jgi:murein DD-endopeptidase MepM/ murein hydrolase activator NlpD